MRYRFDIPAKAKQRVQDAVAHQRDYCRTNGLPEYGFPSSLLLSVPEISEAASKASAHVAKSHGFQSFQYVMHYRDVDGEIYGEVYPS